MKYMGSKARLAKEFSSIMISNQYDKNRWYIEPFAGGMNLICNIEWGNRIANDINFYLIEMWKELVRGWIPEKITREIYNDIKSNYDKYPPYLVGWVGFNCSYCGKWFGGFAGETKTSIGTIRDYQVEAFKNIMKQIPKMKDVVFLNKQYYELEFPPNSIIYCDPPYKGTTGYVNKFDHEHFWQWVRDISQQGNDVFISEYNAPDDFNCIWQKEVKSSLSIDSIGGISKSSVEKLFTLK